MTVPGNTTKQGNAYSKGKNLNTKSVPISTSGQIPALPGLTQVFIFLLRVTKTENITICRDHEGHVTMDDLGGAGAGSTGNVPSLEVL